MKIKKIVDFAKTGLIYLLTASMLAMAGFYINARQNAGQNEEIPREKIRIFEIGGMALAEINENHITPLQITITANKQTFTAIYNDRTVLDIYEHGIKNNIRDIFGKNSACRILSGAEGEELWRRCADSEKSIYVKYAGNYIYPFIYTFLAKESIKNLAEGFSGELAMVRELFIIDDGEIKGVAKDIYDRVSLFEPPPEAKSKIRQRFGETDLSAYKNIAGAVPCEFLKNRDISLQTGANENDIKNLKFSETFHLFQNYEKYSFVLEYSNPLSGEDGKIKIEREYIKNLLKILNFNIENSVSYSENDAMTFRDGKNTIKFFKNGQILYAYKPIDSNEIGGGLHLAKFLSYDDSYYTYYEKIKAASVFVSSLDRELAGNECKIYLKEVNMNPIGEMTAIFSYYYEGAEIKINGSSEAVALTIGENGFTQIKINSLYVTLSEQGMVKNRNPIFDLDTIDREISRERGELREIEEIARKYNLRYDEKSDKFLVSDFKLVYEIDYDQKSGNFAKAVWEVN
ncbi:MAG: hypothetical protein FWG34_05170 [Oscillospiraceae bacterium]|nr:hypothetical protein [Oscillospiraceae bacterium]